MEKLTIVGNFTKTLELLRNTECTSKEKINYFHQISDFIISPAMTSQPNYSKYCSNSIGILLLFCEDLDTTVRMNAEENLNKIIRSMETNRISRILFDLLNEIKKNGNERSLRICLKLFAYYCPRLKETSVRGYALKLLTYLESIAKRKERDLQETLVKFMESFGVNLQVCLNDVESIKLLNVILANIILDCPVKRRCSAQCCILLIENSKNKSYMANHSINNCIEFLKNDVGENGPKDKQHQKDKNQEKKSPTKQQQEQQEQQKQTNTLLGVLGFFRLLFPILISENLSCDVQQIIEIYDFCLYLLNNQNHSIINASLEVINSILIRLPGNEKLVEILTNGNESYRGDVFCKSNDFIDGTNTNSSKEKFLHNEFLKKRKSLKNQIFQLIEKKSNSFFDITPPPRPPKSSHLLRHSSDKSVNINTSTSAYEMTCNTLNYNEQQQQQQNKINKNKNIEEKENNRKHLKSIFNDDDDDNDDDDNVFQKRKTALKTTITNDFSDALIDEELNKHQPVIDNVNKSKNISSENLFVDDDDDGLVTISPPYSTTKMISGSGANLNLAKSITQTGFFNKNNTLKNNISLDDEDETIIIRSGSDDGGIDDVDKKIKNKIKISMHQQSTLKDENKPNNILHGIDDDDDDYDDSTGETKNLNKNTSFPIKTQSKSLIRTSSTQSSSSPMDIADEILRDNDERTFLEDKENTEGFTTISTELNYGDDDSHLRINMSEDKSQILSDIDNESFNSIDFESEITIGGEIQQLPNQIKDKKENSDKEKTNVSSSGSDWKLQKSTESIGNFFNSLLSSSHTESMTKLFRPSTTKLLSSGLSTTSDNNTISNQNKNVEDQNQQSNITMSMTTEESVEKSEECNLMNSTKSSVIMKNENQEIEQQQQQQQHQQEQSLLYNSDIDMTLSNLVTTSTPITTPKIKKKKITMTTTDDDTISLESINSHNSMFSHVSYQSSSGTQDFILKNEQDLKMIQENQHQEQQKQCNKQIAENFIKNYNVDNNDNDTVDADDYDDDDDDNDENNQIRKDEYKTNHHQYQHYKNKKEQLQQQQKYIEKKESQALSKILLYKPDTNVTKNMSLTMGIKMSDDNDKFENLKNMTEISTNDDENEQKFQKLEQQKQKYQNMSRSRTLSTESNCSNISKKHNPFNNNSNSGFTTNNLSSYLEIGEIYDQNIIYYTIRLITTRFLLTGTPYFGCQDRSDLTKSLISDQKVLVSIKHLSLMVISNCVKLMPETLQLPLEFDPIELEKIREFNNRNIDDTNNSSTATSNNSSQDLEKDILQSIEATKTTSVEPLKQFEDPLGCSVIDGNFELEIKDDHFGESTNTEILFNYPLTRNSGGSQTIIEIKNSPLSETKFSEDSKGAKPKSKFSLLNKLKPQFKTDASKSEFHINIQSISTTSTTSSNSMNIDENKPPIVPRRKSPAKELKRVPSESPKKDLSFQNSSNIKIINQNVMKSPIKKLIAPNPNRQFVSDILLFYKHSDPVLRGDIQVIIGNFLHSVLMSGYYNFILNDLIRTNEILNSKQDKIKTVIHDSEYFAKNSLNINRLLAILIMGFRDEIHTVVIHALTSFDKIFPLVMLKHFNNLYQMKKNNKKKKENNNNDKINNKKNNIKNEIEEKNLNLKYKNNNIEKRNIMLPSAEIKMYKDCDTQDTLINEILMMIRIRRNFYNIKMYNNQSISNKNYEKEFIKLSKDENVKITLKMILNEIRLCCHSKNWSVQNKYIEIITNFDIALLQEIYVDGNQNYNYNDNDDENDDYDDEIGVTYQKIFLNEFIEFLGHDDFRVRNHAIQHLSQFIRNQCFIQANITKMKSRHQSKSKKSYNDYQYHNEKEQQQQQQQFLNQYQYWQNQQNNLNLLTEEEQQYQQHYQIEQQYQQQQQQHEQLQQLYITNFNLVKELFNYRIFYGLSPTFGNLLNAKCLPSNQIEKLLANILYILTNKLMELNNKNLQIGVIGAIKILLNEFNPIDFYEQWDEFNISSVCLQFAYENYPLATDISCQNDLIDITTTILTANMLVSNKSETNELKEILFGHIMKILNIYYHLLSNQKPVLFGKSHKTDLFQNSKETAICNNYGYFGNDYLYIKIYNLLKISFDNYKIQINPESGEKMMQLLKTCLNSLSALLDMKEHSLIPVVPETPKSSFSSVLGTPSKKSSNNNSSNSNNSCSSSIDIKIIEEILLYLRPLINYQPVDSIICLRQLLKFLLDRNYANRKFEYEKFTKSYLVARKQISNEPKFNSNSLNKDDDINILSKENKQIVASKEIKKIFKDSEESNKDNDDELLYIKSQQNTSHVYLGMDNLDKNRKQQIDDIGKQQKQRKQQQQQQQKQYYQQQKIVNDRFNQEAETNLLDLFSSCMNFPLGKSKSEEDKHIKLFQPLVVYCLSLFMTSNAIVQRPILDLLSQLLEFNVTYSYLDSKSSVFDQIIKMLELIENEMASRNSSMVVIPIIRFLVNLARQNDKKFITIPKIISHTNSLLANNSIRKCSILALKGLGFELFFNEMPSRHSNTKITKTSSTTSTTITTSNFPSINKELNTQKEVVLDMFEKFIDYSECAKMLVILMLWRNIWIGRHTINNSDDRKKKIEQKDYAIDVAGKRIEDNRRLFKNTTIDLLPITTDNYELISPSSHIPTPTSPMAFAISLQSGGIMTIVSKEICDGKIKLNNWNEFLVLDSIFKNSDKNFLLDSKIYLLLLKFFINKNVTSFNDLSLATIILDNVILKAEEIYLVNHIKLYLENNNKNEKYQNKFTNRDGGEEYDYLKHEQENQQYYDTQLNKNRKKNILITRTTNEIKYFANILYEKLDQCILTLIKSSSEHHQQHQQHLGPGTSATSSILNFVNFSYNNSCKNNNNNNISYHHDNDIHQQLYQEFKEPEQYNKFSKLVVKFVKSIYKDSILKNDSLNSILQLTLEQNNFWQKYNLNNSSYENVKVEIFRMFYIMTNQFNDVQILSVNNIDDDDNGDGDDDSNLIIQENNLNKIFLLNKLKDIDHRIIKRTLIKEIIMKFPHPNLWSIPEIEVLLKNFMIILLWHSQQFLFDLCKITKFRTVFVENLTEYCNIASKDDFFIILTFINNTLTTIPEFTELNSQRNQNNCGSLLPIEIKIEIILKIRTKVQYNRVLQKLIEQIIQNEIESHGESIIEMILSKRNIQLDWILNSNEMPYQDKKNNLKVLDSSIIDENWLINQIIKYSSITNPEQFVNILYDFKSELKLKQILSTENFCIKLILKSALKISFEIMLKQFQSDCIQLNPHINYMRLNPLARVSLNILKESLDNLQQLIVNCNQQEETKYQNEQNIENFNKELWYLATCVIVLLKNIKRIYNIGLIYIDAKFLEKFIKDQVLKSETLIDSLIKFSLILSNHIKDSFQIENLRDLRLYNITNNNSESDNDDDGYDDGDVVNDDSEKELKTTDNKIDLETLKNSSDTYCDNSSTSGDIIDNDSIDIDNSIDFIMNTTPPTPINNKNNVSLNNSNINSFKNDNNTKNNKYNNNNDNNRNCYTNNDGSDGNRKSIEIYTYCKCIDLLLKENLIWYELNKSSDCDTNSNCNSNNNRQGYETHLNAILEFIHIGLIRSLGNTFFYRKYKLEKRNSIESFDMEQKFEYTSSLCLETPAIATALTTKTTNITLNKLKLVDNYGNVNVEQSLSSSSLSSAEDNKFSNEGIKNEFEYNNKKDVIENSILEDDGNGNKLLSYNKNNEIERNTKCKCNYNKRIIIEKAIFIANVIETNCTVNFENSSKNSLLNTLKSIGISLLRMNNFYAYAVTPFEIIQVHHNDYYAKNDDEQQQQQHQCYQKIQGNNSQSGKLPSIPVEELSDVDILQKFIKRLSIFGFTSRQQFEEYFMTFLLLINTDYNDTMVDIHEQFQIRSICLKAILELLITYKTFPIVGNKLSSFHHTTRWSKIKCDSISIKKLHKVQLLVPGSNVFCLPNLERNLSTSINENENYDYNGDFNNIQNSIIGTSLFKPNQYDLNFVWQLMENSNMEPDIKKNVHIRNFQYFREQSEIDFKSSSQLIFDVITQLIETNHVLVLPNLVKFCEICENRDQVKWIRQKILKLQETIPRDDTISHQHIIYLLCKTQSMLIPSTSDLSHLCSLISNYLKSSHVFIRNAALHGLLCLLECCSKTNTTIGKLSDELSMLRDLIIGYIIRHGIVEESSLMFSDLHTKLVWTLNFSLIEMTMKFVPDCNLLSNSIISANNLLKRTSNEDIYLCILHGLERCVITNISTSIIRNKIEKLALELVKLENERFSIPALKLLLSCVYIGSTKQLENTELSNGIVQDDPEIIIQQTDKVDVLLHCIKSSKKSAAQIYGKVLCQIVRDLVPPNEILTKVIKEFLAINQPHCEVIASIVHQVFRSAIDSSFSQMLHEWLICSLPTFLNLPEPKSIWCLTVIFISASINFDLIKLFPVILSNYNENRQQCQSHQIGRFNNSNCVYKTDISLFITSAKDFHSKLNHDQKIRFKEVFQKYQEQQKNLKEKQSLINRQQQQEEQEQQQQQLQNQFNNYKIQEKGNSMENENKIIQLMLDSL